ncbi:MAG: Ig-like domain-containing protein, partial [Acidobacteriota bacterium]
MIRLIRTAVLFLVCASALAQERTVVWSEDFEQYGTASAPERWLDASTLFKTSVDPADPSNMVYGAKHPAPKQRSVGGPPPGDVPVSGATSTLAGRTFVAGDGFEYRGRFRRETVDSLVGFTFFSRQPEVDAFRLIALWRDADDAVPSMRAYKAAGGTTVELSETRFTPEVGVWYRFAIRVDRQTGGFAIRARFWRDGQPEPDDWTLTAVDPETGQVSGRIGLWSENGGAFFDDLSVSAENEEASDRTPPAIVFSESGTVIPKGVTEAFNRDARVDVRALDGSGIKSLTVTLDETAYVPLTPITGERTYVLRARAVDNAGNAAEAQIGVVVDKTPPVIRVVENGLAMPDALLVNRNVVPSFTAEDQTATTLSATVDGQTFTSGGLVPDERTHRLVVSATDAVGWTSSVTRDFIIDRTPPLLVFSDGTESLGPSALRNRDTAVGVTAQDANGIAAVNATLGGAPFVPGTLITAEGAHALAATAVDRAGNPAQAQLALLIDKTPPSVTVTDGDVPLLTGLLTRANVVPRIAVNDLTATTLDAKLDDAPFASGTLVDSERRHTLTVTVTDAVGWTTTLAPIVFTIDRTPPRVTITSPTPEQRVGASSVEVTGDADDAVRVFVNGVEAVIDPSTRIFRRANVPLLEGANPLVATGTDAAGNEGRAEARVHLDTRAPELLVASPAPNVCLATGEVVVRGTVRDAATIRVRANDGVPVTATLAGAEWTATVPLPSEGRIVLLVEAEDEGGHAAAVTVPVIVDRTKPAVTISEGASPLTATLFNRPISPLVSVSDADGGARLSLTLNGNPFSAGSVLGDDGTYVLRATATDCAGNVQSEERSFTIDRTPPRIESIAPADGATVGTRPPLTGTLSEPATLIDEATGTAATVSGVSFTISSTLTEGLNERTFVATDPAGNTSRTPYSLRVKSDAPVVEIVERGLPIPAAALYNRVLAPLVRVNDPAATITATLNGQPFTSGTEIGADASYTLEATATDTFGHVSDRASATFTIDRTPPRIDITTPADGGVIPVDAVQVRGTVDADAVSVTVNGAPATLDGTNFTASVLLEQGANLLTGSAVDRAGNTGRDRVEVRREGGPLAIILTSPPDAMLTNRPTTVVAGHVLTTPPSGTVKVNGIDLPVAAGGTFRKIDFPLVEGANDIVASVASASGEVNSVSVDVQADFTPPLLLVKANALALADGARFATAPLLSVEATDNVPQGLTTAVTIDGTAITGDLPMLPNGGHALTAIARDAAGNETRVDRTLFIGEAEAVTGCGLSDIDPPTGTAVFTDLLRVTGRSGGALGVLINGNAAQVADGSFCGEATLTPGRNEIVIRCADASGNPNGDAPVTIVVDRDVEPSITITGPVSGATVITPTITVTGTAGLGVISGDVNGLAFTVPADGASSHAFSVANVALSPGLNTVVARAKTGSGRTAITTARVTLLGATPELTITSPIDSTETGASSIDVTGTYLNVDPATIAVNGAPATTTALSDTAGTFRATASLAPGLLTTIVAGGRNQAGVEARETVDVQQVAGAPSIDINAPLDDTFFASTVSDVAVSGTIVAPAGSQVAVSGVLATVSGTTFTATVPLGTTAAIPLVARVSTPAGEDALDAIRVVRFATPLALRESFPSGDATGVDRGVAFILLFNNVLDATTVESSIRVADAAGANVPGALFVDRDAVTFAPNAPLQANVSYTISMATTLRDAANGALASAQTVRFTTAGTAPAAAPVVDDLETTGCFTTVTMTGRASTPGARVRLDADGVTLTTVASDSGAFRFLFSFSGRPGFHLVRVRELGSDGSLSSERALCFRLNCELPRVIGAALDRAAKKVTIDFSRPMDPSTLVVGGTILFTPSLAGTVAFAGQTATVSFDGDVPAVKVTLTVKQSVKDLDGASLAADYTQDFTIETDATERGKGYVSGAVYDATTGRPLPGATIDLADPGTALIPSPQSSSVQSSANDRGRYSRALAEGAYTITASADGYTSVWRQAVVPAGAGVVPIDIRLTRRGTGLTDGGDTSVTHRVELTLPGTLTANVTAVGAQSLAGLLPLGWSPFASAEVTVPESPSSRAIAPTGTQMSSPASAVVSAPMPGAKLTFLTGNVTENLTAVKYDHTRDEWRVVQAALVASDGRVVVDIAESGHYALVYPDAAGHLAHPLPPVNGEALQGVIDRCLTEPARCSLRSRSFTLEPNTILPNGRAVATLTTEGAAEVYPSGTAVQAYIDEQLNLSDGRVLVDPPFATDLLLYRTFAGDAAVADFHLAPTPQAAAVLLRDGVEHVRFVEYPGRIDRGTLLGAEGGRVPGDGGVTIDVPGGATPEPLHASATTIPAADLGSFGTIAGFRIAGGFTLSLTRASEAAPADGVVEGAPSLLIPARAAFVVTGAATQVVLAEVLPATPYGVLLRLVAIADPVADVTGGKLFATRTVDSTQLPLDGVVRDGRYLILAAQAPVAYAFGIVRGGSAGTGSAVADVRVATTLGIYGLTTRGGLFVLPVSAKPSAPFALTPRTLSTGDGATVIAPTAPESDAYVDAGVLPLAPQPPVLRSVTPDGGEIPAAAAFVVRAEFDVPIDAASVAGGIRVMNLTAASELPGTVSAAGNSVTFNAGAPLNAGSQYAITIAATLRGANGAAFGQTVTKSFRTASLPSNSTVRPDRIHITIPDANGHSLINGLAGALPSGAQAVAVRRGHDFIVRYQATVSADGSFSFPLGHEHPSDRISTDDLIDLQVLDPVSRGIIAVVELTPFAANDHRSFIAPVGRETVFVSADGIRVRVPAGAFDVPTLIEVTLATQAPFADVPKFADELRFGTAVELRFDGIAKKRIDLDLPIPEGLSTAGRNWYVGQLGQSIRGPRVMIVDLAYTNDGRFFTGLAPAGGSARDVATNAAITGPELRDYLLGVGRSGIFALVDFQLSAGSVGFGILSGMQAGYDLFWDTLESLYAAHFYLLEGRGRIAIPVVMGRQFQIVGVDSSTGLDAFAKVYDPIPIGDPGTTVSLPNPNPDLQGPYPILGSPFRIEALDLNVEDIALDAIRDFTVTLSSSGTVRATTTLPAGVNATLMNVSKGVVDPSRTGGL